MSLFFLRFPAVVDHLDDDQRQNQQDQDDNQQAQPAQSNYYDQLYQSKADYLINSTNFTYNICNPCHGKSQLQRESFAVKVLLFSDSSCIFLILTSNSAHRSREYRGHPAYMCGGRLPRRHCLQWCAPCRLSPHRTARRWMRRPSCPRTCRRGRRRP